MPLQQQIFLNGHFQLLNIVIDASSFLKRQLRRFFHMRRVAVALGWSEGKEHQSAFVALANRRNIFFCDDGLPPGFHRDCLVGCKSVMSALFFC